MFEGKKFFTILGTVSGVGSLGAATGRGLEIREILNKIHRQEELLDSYYHAFSSAENQFSAAGIRFMYIDPAERYIATLKEQTSFFNDLSHFDDYAAYLAVVAALSFLAASCFKNPIEAPRALARK